MSNLIFIDCTSITQSSTIRFVAVTESKATIKCGASSARFNNLYVCGVQNISFHGINFEECGSNSSNVFFRESSDITFQRCTFRYVCWNVYKYRLNGLGDGKESHKLNCIQVHVLWVSIKIQYGSQKFLVELFFYFSCRYEFCWWKNVNIVGNNLKEAAILLQYVHSSCAFTITM